MKKSKFISKKALNHATKGEFCYPRKFFPHKILTMMSGGHGEDNISYLRKKGFVYEIDTVYDNGVRLGHIKRHTKKRNSHKNGHAWLPWFWKKSDIKKAGQYVASLKRNTPLVDHKNHSGRYKGVSVGITSQKNRIQTIFPLFDVNKHAKKRTQIAYKK